MDFYEISPKLSKIKLDHKICPKCGKTYGKDENFCFDCLVALEKIRDSINVKNLDVKCEFSCPGKNEYLKPEEILCEENLSKINGFGFSYDDYTKIITDIKRTALTGLDSAIKENDIALADLDTDDKILLFAKTFVDVDFKSFGQELGHFTIDKITIDERQTSTMMVTTLIHELAHFLIQEILAQILSKLLDATKNSLIEVIVAYILSSSDFTALIDEYCAHSTEGRFTVYGFQDYSSFISILQSLEGKMDIEEVEITKSIANTFANSIKDIMESFISHELRNEIRDEFFEKRIDSPDYGMLRFENCRILTEEGFLKAVWLVLSDGFSRAMSDIKKVSDMYEC